MSTMDEGSGGTINYNIALGVQALSGADLGSGTEDISHNIAIGTDSLRLTSGDASTGQIAIGRQALSALTSGNRTTAIGYQAGLTATTIDYTTIVGYQAGLKLLDSTHNTLVGYNAGYSLGSDQASNNTFIGTTAGANGDYTTTNNNTANNNVGIGKSAMGDKQGSGSDFTFTGYSNVAVGVESLQIVRGGHKNTCLGFRSGQSIGNGDAHTLIGYSSGSTIDGGRRCTVIGDSANVSSAGAIDQIVIGQGATGVGDNTAIIGNSSVTDVYMGDNGSAWSTTSDGRLKENIEEWSTGLDAINKLRVVEYNFKEDNPYKYDHKKKRQGIIAQEAIEAIPEMVKDDGEWLSANQEPMIWALVNSIKELTNKVNELETKLKEK